MLDRLQVKADFERSVKDHKMEILRDDGLYRHLRFTDGGSQVYRFDIHTWPGFLCICQDMGTYVFSRTPDMFEFFKMGEDDFNSKYVINPGYWAEKLQAVDRSSGNYEEFSMDMFRDNVKHEYDMFAEQYQDEDEEAVTEAYPEGTQSYKQMLEDLWQALEDEVLNCDSNGVRAYDAAMDFRWASDNGELEFDMCDFWDYSNNDYTFHYIWILYAIVWGIGQYEESKELVAA